MKKITLVLALIFCTASAPVRANDVVFNFYKDKVSQIFQQQPTEIFDILMNQIVQGERELRSDIVFAVSKSMGVCVNAVKNQLRRMEFAPDLREAMDQLIAQNFTDTQYTKMACEIIYDKLVKMNQENPNQVQLNGDIERIKSDISCRVNDALERQKMQADSYAYFKDDVASFMKLPSYQEYVAILANIAQQIEKGEPVSGYDIDKLVVFFKNQFLSLKDTISYAPRHRAQLIANLRFTDEQFLQMVIDLIGAEVEIKRSGADPALMQMAAPAPAIVAAEEAAAVKARITEEVRQAVVAAIANAKAHARARAYA